MPNFNLDVADAVAIQAVGMSVMYLEQSFIKGISSQPSYDALHELSADSKVT